MNKIFFLVIIIRIKPLNELNVKHTGKLKELLVAQYKNINVITGFEPIHIQ